MEVGAYLFFSFYIFSYRWQQINWKYRGREWGTDLGSLIARDCSPPTGILPRKYVATTFLLLSARVTA